MDLILGSRYRLTTLLGRGGMGEVWRGIDTSLDRPVAVKLIRIAGVPSGTEYDSLVRRFRREAKAVAALNHPNIVTAYDFGIDADEMSPYLVMEFIDGRSLATEMAERMESGAGALAVDRVVAIARDVCAGLGAAHRAGVVHRDLKPANLMTVAGTERVKIVDFGISRGTDMSRITSTGGLLGTVAYMAPEQITGGEIDGRTDLYALGCVMYDLLTGGSAFAATDPAQFLFAHVSATPRPLRQLRPDAPAALEALLLDLLAKAPADRPRDADAVVTRLATVDRPAPVPRAAGVAAVRVEAPRSAGPVVDPATRAEPERAYAPAVGVAATNAPPVRRDAPDTRLQPADPTPGRTVRRRAVIAAAVVVTTLVAAYIVVNGPFSGGHGAADGPSTPASTPPTTGSPPGSSTSPPVTTSPSTSTAAAVKPHQIAAFTAHASGVEAVAYSPDGRILASGGDDKTVRLWNASTHAAIATLTGHAAGVSSVAFSPDGQILASGGYDNTVRLWDVATYAPIATLTGHGSGVEAVAFSPDGRILASASYDRTVRLWDVATHGVIAVLTGHTSDVWSVAFSPDGTILASGSYDKTIKLWNVATHGLIATLTGHTSGVSSVAFSPDGKTLASGSYDNTIRLWDVASHNRIATLTGHTGHVWCAVFSPDGKTLASSGTDHTVRLWNVATHAPVATLTGHTNYASSVAFSPDGRTLASSGFDRTIRLWSLG